MDIAFSDGLLDAVLIGYYTEMIYRNNDSWKEFWKEHIVSMKAYPELSTRTSY